MTGASDYRLDVSTDNTFTANLIGYSNLTVSGTSQAVTGLTAGTTYYVRVRAANAAGTSGQSGTLTQITVPNAPAAPTAGTITGTAFVVSWTAVTGATSYKLDVATDSAFSNKLASYNDVTATSGTTVSGLSPATTYYVRVRAVNSGGTSASSSTLTQATASATPTITGAATATAFTTTYGTASAAQTFSVSGSNLGANLVATAPTGFEISSDGTTYGSTATFTQTSGSASGTLRIRLAANAAVSGSYNSQNIVLSSTGASSVNITTASTGNAVSPKALSVTAPTIASKVYDGTTTAGAVTVGTLSGFVGSETVTATATAAAYSSKNVGSYSGVVVTYTLANGTNGGLASNYSLANGSATGTVTAKALSVTAPSIASKVYDGTTTAGTVTVGTLSGFIGTETVTATGAAAAYSSKNVGSYSGVVVTYTLADGTNGGLASNYSLANGSATGTITAKALSVTTPTIASKVYDGTTTAGAVTVGTISGFVGSETVTATATATTSSANAGTYATTPVTYTLANGTNGGLASNYSLASGSASASITAKPLTVTANNVTKTYGSALTGGAGSTAFTSSGLVGSQTIGSVTITYTGTPSGASASDAATTYSGTVVPSSATGGTFTASNYNITYNAGNVTVNKAVLTATAGNQTVVAGTAATTVTGNGTVTYTGFVNGENSSVVSGTVTYTTTYTNSDAAGTAGRTITPVVTNLTATNYTFSAANGTVTVVSPNYGLRDDGGVNLPTLTYSVNGSSTTEKGSVFNGKNLSSSASSLSLTGANIQIWKQSGGNVTGTKLEYKVWKTTDSEPAAYTERAVGWSSEVAGGTTTQVWSSFGSAIDLISGLGSNYGTYNLKVRFTVQGTGYAGTVTDGPVTATFTYPQPPSITIGGATAATSTAFTTTYGTPSAAQTFTIAGSNLTANITATAPSGFQVSSDGSAYGTTATFTQSSGAASGTLYVRLAATATVAGAYNSQNIALTSTDATTRNITTAASGNAVSRKGLGITVASQTIKFGFPATGGTSVTAGAAVNGYTVTTADLVNGETSSVITGTPSYSTTYVQGDEAGTAGRTISVSGLSAANYTLNITNGTVTINTLQNPTSTATATGTTTINVATTNDDFVMIVRHTADSWTAPTQGSAYSAGNALGSGVVRYVGPAETFGDTGLTPGTTYYYKVYTEYYNRYSGGATTTSATTTGTPSITIGGATSATATAFTTTYGTASAQQSFTIAGTNLTANISVGALAGFEYSIDNGATWGTTRTITQSSGNASATLLVRLAATATVAGTYNSQNIALTSTDATTRNITTAASGNAVSRKGLGITVANRTITYGFPATGGTSVLSGGNSYSVNAADLVNGESASVVTGTATYTTTYVQGDTAGTAGRTITVTGLTAANYTLNITPGTITVETLNNPSPVAASSSATNSVSLTHTRTNGIHVMIVRKQGSAVSFSPTQGSSYTDGQTVDGHTIVKASLGADSYTDSGLASNTEYHYKVFSEYYGYYSAGVTASTTTLGPTISTSGSFSAMSTTYGTVAASGSNVTVTASYLTASLTATAPTGFEVSSDGTAWGSTATFVPSSGSVNGTLRIRLAATAGVANSPYSGNVALSSAGATSVNVAVPSSSVNASTLASGNITLTRTGDIYSASSSGVSGFTLSYVGRTANDIATSYAASSTAPTAAGYYTVTATSSDSNYTGSKSEQYFIAGPVPANDDLSRPTATMNIPRATLLQNDKRIDSSGNVQTNNLSITAVSAGTGSPTVALSGTAFVSFSPGGSSTETFTYTLSDGVANKTAIGTVTVAPMVWDNSFEVTGTKGSAVYADGITEVTLTFTGTPNVTYQIQYRGELNQAWKNAGGWYSENGTFEVYIQEEGDHAADWNGSMFFQGKR